MQSGQQLPPLDNVIPLCGYCRRICESVEERAEHEAICTMCAYRPWFPVPKAPLAHVFLPSFDEEDRSSSKTGDADTVSLSPLRESSSTSSSESASSITSSNVDRAGSLLDIPVSLTQNVQSSGSRHGSVEGLAEHDRCSIGRPPEQNRQKNENEKMKREDLSAQHQTLENTLQFGCGIETGTPQQPANRMSSGLTINKKHTLEHTITIFSHLVSKSIEEAISKGDINLHFSEMRELLERSPSYPTQGTIMDDGNAPPCGGEKGQGQRKKLRRCITHDHYDWVACSKVRAGVVTKRNIDRLRSTAGTSRIGLSQRLRE